jgi:FemAB-related protein (PEP-CTERM system-associated)
MLVVSAVPGDAARWNEYVAYRPEGCVYHRFEWGELFARAYGSAPVYLLAQQGRSVVGALPMIELRSALFGKILSSMPYFGHGGMLADDELVAVALAEEAGRIALRRGARFMELRHLVEHELGWFERRDKANMALELPGSYDTLLAGFKAKLRSQIKRPEKAGHQVIDGRHELLHPFWLVYSENMRDLGSPCHSERLFGEILDTFGPRSRVVVVLDGGEPVAAGIVVGNAGTRVSTLEIPCASSLRRANKTSPNMMLYSRVLRFACDEGYRRFNFGRSTIDSGTYRFKEQWGAAPRPIVYHVWVPPGAPPPGLRPDSPKFKAAAAAWTRLPVPVARLLGPRIVHGIP